MTVPPPALRWLREPTPWWIAFSLAGVACLILLGLNSWLSELRPGNAWGIGYGITGGILCLGALLYVVRRRAPGRGLARSHNWLQFHVFGGTLFLLLVFMHTGFRFPGGVLGWGLWVLSVWVVFTGILGTIVQKWIPRLLTSGLSTEVHYDRIQELVEEIRERASALAAASHPAVRHFYQENLAELLEKPQIRLIYFIDITGGIQSRIRQFRYLRDYLDAGEQAELNAMESLAITKLELDAHYTLQKALRGWLYGHVPFSLALIVLVCFHVFSVLYY